jgi:CubicO group peptidase (beta-lactamase class C family)
MMNMRTTLVMLALAGSAHLSAQDTAPLSRSTPEAQGISSSAVLSFVQAADSGVDAMHSVMIARHGRVVAEGWWGPYDASTPHMLYSLSKSFTSTAVGLAIAEGKLTLDDPVLKFFPDDAPPQPSANLRAMRVRDLLRMSTGHQSEPSLMSNSDTALPGSTWVKRFLAHPVPFKPGTHFLYNSPSTYMLSAIVQKVTGMTVLDYLRPRLFEPLGIEHPTWVSSPQGVSAGAYGLMVRTEDVARLGQLYLQKGMWQGRQLVPAAWVAQATAFQTSNGSSPTSDWDQGYGYQFWRSRHQTYRGDGAFGQYMMVMPEQDAVVVITSGVRNMQAVMDLVWDKLLPAMSSRRLPEDAATQRTLKAKLAGLTVRMPLGRPSTALSTTVSRRWYELPMNDRGIQAIALDLDPGSLALLVRTSAGESRTPMGVGTWVRGRSGYASGIDGFLSVPATPEIAASGAWSADSVFTLKLIAPQTPFYSTLSFRFDRDRLLLDTEYNVSFGPTRLPVLEGRTAGVK